MSAGIVTYFAISRVVSLEVAGRDGWLGRGGGTVEFDCVCS